MKLRSVLKIATITSVVLLCIGFVVLFYFRMTKVEKAEDFDLYSIVPSNAIAIVDSDNVVDLLKGINELSYSNTEGLSDISILFSQLKEYINTLLSETPHGFSRQMSKMLISFHEPDNNRNQVFYCRLGVGDKDVVDRFIKKYCESSFPSKYFDYKGEEISIYSMPDDSFLACYITSDFMVVSYQKKLIEQVIDSKLSKKSILNDPGFSPKRTTARNQHPAIVHLRMSSINIGKDSLKTCVGGWTEFSLKINSDIMYFAGVNHTQDSTVTFMNVLKNQKPVENLSGDILPASTFYIKRHSVADLESIFEFTSMGKEDQSQMLYIKDKNRELMSYLNEHAKNSATTCIFYPSDSVFNTCMVINIPVTNQIRAERFLRNLSTNTVTGTHTIYSLPENTLLSQLTGTSNSSTLSYACFYKGSMLVGLDNNSILAYIDNIEKGNTLEADVMYEETKANLSDLYSFLLIADLGEIKKQPTEYSSLVPNFFFRNSNFFENFILSSQFTCVDSIVYPNVVLLYKEKAFPSSAQAAVIQ
ncbi:DUF3352 domain-containing protein [Bacteroides sp. 519]|uniref:DUF3352 domain-containing protein n=1 Tax=Bacteroides sp. 519 TaxID=2302937 RepID=UPI0013D5AAA8|nr:DUF3352 domain-containing protein [Bacteroides sp. 519]NDV56648.1 DUF3352 domain-containing protein [Bacteroides sp. 519]